MGPFPITQINDNGTVRFQKGIINDATNIFRIKPLFEKTHKQYNSFTTQAVSILKNDTKRVFTTQLFLFKQITMARCTFNKESTMMPPITYQHPEISL